MGGAIARGLAASQFVPAADICVTRRDASRLADFAALGMTVTTDNAAAAASADVMIVAVKPWMAEDVCRSLAPSVRKGTLVASVVAGLSTAKLAEYFGGECPIFRVMPNTGASVGESMSFVSAANSTPEQNAVVLDIFGKIGSAMLIEEHLMGAATALSGCGIAYALRYIRASVEAGVELGFKADVAAAIVAQTVKGAAELILRNGSNPEAEIDKVTTPGGWTIKGLNALEHAGFTSAVIKGIIASSK